jgi:hypothetical protein
VKALHLLRATALVTAGVTWATSTAPAQDPPTGPAASNRPPSIEVDSAACAPPAARPRVCAFVFDDKAVARVRAVFRAEGTRGYYWTLMTFEGTRYCAWLPQPTADTHSVDYYVEAFDDEYELSRSRGLSIEIRAGCAAPEGKPPAAPAAVGVAGPGQPPVPPGFEPSTVTPGK